MILSEVGLVEKMDLYIRRGDETIWPAIAPHSCCFVCLLVVTV